MLIIPNLFGYILGLNWDQRPEGKANAEESIAARVKKEEKQSSKPSGRASNSTNRRTKNKTTTSSATPRGSSSSSSTSSSLTPTTSLQGPPMTPQASPPVLSGTKRKLTVKKFTVKKKSLKSSTPSPNVGLTPSPSPSPNLGESSPGRLSLKQEWFIEEL